MGDRGCVMSAGVLTARALEVTRSLIPLVGEKEEEASRGLSSAAPWS